MPKLISFWKKFRSHYWLALGFDLIALLLVMWGIHAWQTRDLPFGEAAPSTVLKLLVSSELATAIEPGEAGVVYFFAPWCGICKSSIDNLDQQVLAGDIEWATAIALDFANPSEVAEFVAETEIVLPVLLGSGQTAKDWNIRAFPTYFVIDDAGNIASRSVGYSTSLGLRLRNWLAQ
ncbi:MAG: redoxin domain-containing protein [Xanthomonadales bacterium]|nr:redoxin domain-containing protein [Xanthomonadales bacterium]